MVCSMSPQRQRKWRRNSRSPRRRVGTPPRRSRGGPLGGISPPQAVKAKSSTSLVASFAARFEVRSSSRSYREEVFKKDESGGGRGSREEAEEEETGRRSSRRSSSSWSLVTVPSPLPPPPPPPPPQQPVAKTGPLPPWKLPLQVRMQMDRESTKLKKQQRALNKQKQRQNKGEKSKQQKPR